MFLGVLRLGLRHRAELERARVDRKGPTEHVPSELLVELLLDLRRKLTKQRGELLTRLGPTDGPSNRLDRLVREPKMLLREPVAEIAIQRDNHQHRRRERLVLVRHHLIDPLLVQCKPRGERELRGHHQTVVATNARDLLLIDLEAAGLVAKAVHSPSVAQTAPKTVVESSGEI